MKAGASQVTPEKRPMRSVTERLAQPGVGPDAEFPGFNDVSFHGSPQIPTPNIDDPCLKGGGGLASRYETHMVGKWHIGQNQLAALPTSRYLWGAEDYWTHMTGGAYDLLDGTRSAFEYNGTHSCCLEVQPWKETAWLVGMPLLEHMRPGKWFNSSGTPAPTSDVAAPQPFFIYLAFQNVHWRFDGKTGNNSVRQSVCALASALDDAVGEVIHTLKEQGLYEDTLIIFASDNGGPTNGDEGSWSSNYPLRGGKNSLWEGGTRVAAAIRGPGIAPELVGTVSYHKVHAADWLPTLVRIAADDSTWLERNWPRGEPRLILGDGIDVWDTFSKGLEVRNEVLLEAHPEHHWQMHGNALIVGDWKIIRFGYMAFNPKVEFGWVPPPGQRLRSTTRLLASWRTSLASSTIRSASTISASSTSQRTPVNTTTLPSSIRTLCRGSPVALQSTSALRCLNCLRKTVAASRSSSRVPGARAMHLTRMPRCTCQASLL
ncbi:Arsb, partial [Symbiodinium sp. CCMP2456]